MVGCTRGWRADVKEQDVGNVTRITIMTSGSIGVDVGYHQHVEWQFEVS